MTEVGRQFGRHQQYASTVQLAAAPGDNGTDASTRAYQALCRQVLHRAAHSYLADAEQTRQLSYGRQSLAGMIYPVANCASEAIGKLQRQSRPAVAVKDKRYIRFLHSQNGAPGMQPEPRRCVCVNADN